MIKKCDAYRVGWLRVFKEGVMEKYDDSDGIVFGNVECDFSYFRVRLKI